MAFFHTSEYTVEVVISLCADGMLPQSTEDMLPHTEQRREQQIATENRADYF